MKNPQYSRFMIISKIHKDSEIEIPKDSESEIPKDSKLFKIESEITHKTHYIPPEIHYICTNAIDNITFIGIYKDKSFYYTYVQLYVKIRVYQTALVKKLNISSDQIFKFNSIRPDLELIKKEGELRNPGPLPIKKNLKRKEIIHGINTIGNEDISHIKHEEIISIINSGIKKKMEEVKEETLTCSCFQTPCQRCGISKCEECYFVLMRENHSNPKCEEIKEIYYKSFDIAEECFQYVAAKWYCETQGDDFYNKFEKLLYGNKMNINVYISDKKNEYYYFDGTDFQSNKRTSYYEHVLSKRIEMLKNILLDTIEFWASTNESFRLYGGLVRYHLMSMIDILLSLNEPETSTEKKKRKKESIFKTRRSNSKLLSSLVENSIYNSMSNKQRKV